MHGIQGGGETALGGSEEVLNDWATTAEMVKETARKVLGMTSEQRKEDKEAWWWNEQVKENIRKNNLVKKIIGMVR